MKPNVIIVDDIDVNRFLIKEIIKEKPIEITEATNGEECINLINNNTKLIFMDVMMPIMNGIEATKIINEKYPNIIVIGITGQYESKEHKIFHEILYKPYNGCKLIDILKKYNIII